MLTSHMETGTRYRLGLGLLFCQLGTQESDGENINHADYACLIMQCYVYSHIVYSTKNSGNIFLECGNYLV